MQNNLKKTHTLVRELNPQINRVIFHAHLQFSSIILTARALERREPL